MTGKCKKIDTFMKAVEVPKNFSGIKPQAEDIRRRQKIKLPQKEQKKLDNLLFEAVKEGDTAKLKNALEKGARVNARDTNGATAGHYAARYGFVNCIKVLKQYGWHVNAKNSIGETAGHYAARYGRSYCLQVLKELGLDVEIKDMFGMTVKDYMTQTGNKNMVDLAELI